MTSLRTTFPAALALSAVLLTAGMIAAPSASADEQLDAFTAGDAPSGVAFLPDGSLAYVSSANTDSVTVVDFATRATIDDISVGDSPADLEVTPDGSQVWVTNAGAGTVSVIDTADFNVIDTITVGTNPRSIAMTSDGALAYVVNTGSNSVSKVNISTRTVVATITVTGTPTAAAVSPDDRFVWITQTLSGSVVPIVVLTNALGVAVDVGSAPLDLVFSNASAALGQALYVSNSLSDSITVITYGIVSGLPVILADPTEIALPHAPGALAIPGDQRVLYVAFPGFDQLGVVDLSTETLGYVAAVGNNPVAIRTNDTNEAQFVAYVASQDDDGITVIGLTVDRTSGATRYDVGVQIALKKYPSGAGRIFIATGANYPDALSAGPSAARLNAPLLLTPGATLDPGVANYISTTSPTADITIVGGPNSVSEAVRAQLDALTTGVVTRISGANRYEASRNVVAAGFTSTPVVYLTTGRNFPDALSAGTASAPVILVDGTASTVDSDTLQLIEDLGATTIKIAGGPNSVSNAIKTQLEGLGFTVIRLGGASRYDASVSINRDAYTGFRDAFVATGVKFPDALAATPWATGLGGLYVVPTECMPAPVLSDLITRGVSQLHLVGGTASLSTAVEFLTPCP